jgi:hypothetical protein
VTYAEKLAAIRVALKELGQDFAYKGADPCLAGWALGMVQRWDAMPEHMYVGYEVQLAIDSLAAALGLEEG